MLRIDPHLGTVVSLPFPVMRTSMLALGIVLCLGAVRFVGNQFQDLPEANAYVPASADVSSPPDMQYMMGVAETEFVARPSSYPQRFLSFEAQGNQLVWIEGSPEVTVIDLQDPVIDPIEVLRWRLFLIHTAGQGQYALSFRLPFACQSNALLPGSTRSPDGWETVRAQWDPTEPR